MLRQKDLQLQETSQVSQRLQQRLASGDDLTSQLAQALKRVNHLTAARTAAQQLENKQREEIYQLQRDLRSTQHELATFKRRYEEAARDAAQAAERAASLVDAGGGGSGGGSGGGVDGAGGGGGDGGGAGGGAGAKGGDDGDRDAGGDVEKQLEDLKNEYSLYRRRALEIISSKDREIQQVNSAKPAMWGGYGTPCFCGC